jgi:acetyl-CoA acetyltransferase family protein
MKEVVIVSALRTPITKFRGEFASLTVPELGAIVLKQIIQKTGLDPIDIDEVIFGNLFGSDWGNPARCSLLAAGLPISLPAFTIDRQCGSSLSAVTIASALIQSGAANIIIAGGVESYSQQPHYIRRSGSPYPADLELLSYKPSAVGYGHDVSMIQTAENLAQKYGITRHECDVFALKSHQKATVAWESNRFADQVIPVTLLSKRGEVSVIDQDTCVRKDTSLEKLSRLNPIIKNGVVTAGNASPQNDAASCVLLMDRDTAERMEMKPLAVVKEYASAGCEPTLMGLGPVYSTRKLMKKTGYTIDDFDLVELNEAFAAQTIACVKELQIDESRLNVEGGAIAIGHPNAASGGILIARMIYALKRRNLHRGLITFCCGGGQGVSLIVENA